MRRRRRNLRPADRQGSNEPSRRGSTSDQGQGIPPPESDTSSPVPNTSLPAKSPHDMPPGLLSPRLSTSRPTTDMFWDEGKEIDLVDQAAVSPQVESTTASVLL